MNEIYSIEEYIALLPDEWQDAVEKLRAVIKNHIPEGFEEIVNYSMIGYVVPHKIYPKGYHCDPHLPLPFINIASYKNYISLYHMGIYADKELLIWFEEEYAKVCKNKLDMGKSCIRFKRIDDIPYDLIGELVSKMTVGDWIEKYDKVRPK